MVRFLDAAQTIAVTLWIGTLWTSGLVVAPLLFHALSDRALAGAVAGQLFEVTASIGLVCGVCVLIVWFVCLGTRGAPKKTLGWLVVAMLVLGLVGQFGIQPVLAAMREQMHPQPVMESGLGPRFAFWHIVATILYLLQCLLGLVLVLSLRGPGVRLAMAKQ
ncbi:MAG: DUF4149 domain-containing protein [Betaproteobacteria bacterium]|nr:MAG: DUF4149 domain-containing protein [Betaproteobacteria bacterium]